MQEYGLCSSNVNGICSQLLSTSTWSCPWLKLLVLGCYYCYHLDLCPCMWKCCWFWYHLASQCGVINLVKLDIISSDFIISLSPKIFKFSSFMHIIKFYSLKQGLKRILLLNRKQCREYCAIFWRKSSSF